MLSKLIITGVLLSALPLFGQAKAGKAKGKLTSLSKSSGPLLVNINNPSFRRLVLAIPAIMVADKGASDAVRKDGVRASDKLSELLMFSGLFNVMSSKAYADVMKTVQKQVTKTSIVEQSGMAGIDKVQWKAIGVESLTLGELTLNKDSYDISLKTVDINRGDLIVGRKFTSVARGDLEAVMRRYADLVLEAYTGKTGIFNSKIVFVGRRSKHEDKQVFISDFDGTNLVQITREKVPHLSPAWSLDGKYITFTSYKDGNPDLFIYTVATGRVKKLSGYQGINSGSNWSPEGKWVAYSGAVKGDVNIYLIKPNGGKRFNFISGNGLDVDPSFSPDGKYLAFVSGRYGNPHIFRAELTRSDAKPRVVGDKRLTYAGWYNASPAWTPDSQKLAFAGYDKDIDRFDLFMMNPDGSNMDRLTLRAGDNESPSWSPNGQMLMFQSNRIGTQNRKGPTNIYIMNRDGSSQRKINVGLYEALGPSWSRQLP
jgi:TolB protein